MVHLAHDPIQATLNASEHDNAGGKKQKVSRNCEQKDNGDKDVDNRSRDYGSRVGFSGLVKKSQRSGSVVAFGVSCRRRIVMYISVQEKKRR
jgi:hypothetical protein